MAAVRPANTPLVLGFVVILGCLAGVLLLGGEQREMRHEAVRREAIFDEKVRSALSMREAILERSFRLTFASTHDDFFDRDAQMDSFARAAVHFIVARDRLQGLIHTDEEKTALAKLEEQIMRLRPVVDAAMAKVVASDDHGAVRGQVNSAVQAQNALIEAVNAFVTIVEETAARDRVASADALEHADRRVIALAVGAFVLAAAIGFGVVRRETSLTGSLAQKIDELSETTAKLERFTRRVETELNAARRLQTSLLPTEAQLREIHDTHKLDVVGRFQPSSELSGDLWAALPLPDWRVGVLIADLTGHGVSAALNAFRLHGLFNPTPPFATDVAGFLAFLGRRLRKLLPPGQFAACFYAIIDPVDGSIECAGGAMPPPIFVYEPGAEAETIDTRGLPLGVTDKPSHKTHRRKLEPGGILLCYSDALIETPDKDGKTITIDDLRNWVTETAAAGGDVVETVWEAAIERLGTSLPDDLTLVGIRRRRTG